MAVSIVSVAGRKNMDFGEIKMTVKGKKYKSAGGKNMVMSGSSYSPTSFHAGRSPAGKGSRRSSRR